MKIRTIALLPCLMLFLGPIWGQVRSLNEDESKVPSYVLPEVLLTQQGQKITTAAVWEKVRRPELMRLFEEQEYGKVPAQKVHTSWQIITNPKEVLHGEALMQQIKLQFSRYSDTLSATLLLFLPAHPMGKVPVFLGYNFDGNHTVFPDPSILLPVGWVMNDEKSGITDHKANAASRGMDTASWPVDEIIHKGYGLATLYYGDIVPDYAEGYEYGIEPLFYAAGQNKPRPDEWGTIAAWAWGLSRVLDYLQSNPAVDDTRVIAIGHSRLGKTALWAGAQDTRFAMVISNNSGCGGAALSKRAFGETVARINASFPHWFCDQFKQYNDREENLPFDQHELIALIAPRPVYIASATEDLWADPHGEFLSGVYATPVYHLYGLKGLEQNTMPAPEVPLQEGSVAYHLRTGKHAITRYDWNCYLDYADRKLKKK